MTHRVLGPRKFDATSTASHDVILYKIERQLVSRVYYNVKRTPMTSELGHFPNVFSLPVIMSIPVPPKSDQETLKHETEEFNYRWIQEAPVVTPLVSPVFEYIARYPTYLDGMRIRRRTNVGKELQVRESLRQRVDTASVS